MKIEIPGSLFWKENTTFEPIKFSYIIEKPLAPYLGQCNLNTDDQQIDVIVVGTGPGGATVAKELSQRNKKVVILEWGDNAPLTGSFWQGFKTLLMPGKCLLFTNQLLGMVRGITTGGSTIHYYATCYPVPFDIFKFYGINLVDEVEETFTELPVGSLKDEMVGPMAKRIMESALDLGYNWQKLDKFMYQDKWKPDYKFGHYGDPYGVKWSARMFVEEAVNNGSILINGAKVTKVLIENRTAVGVEFKKGWEKSKIFAAKVIISAGGIGTPVILRASGIKQAGYNFFFDPLIGVRGTVKDITVPTSEIPMTAGVNIEDEDYMMTDMAHSFSTTALFAAEVFRFDKMFSRKNTLQIMVKAKDTLGGCLTDSGGVQKKLNKNDKRKLQSGYERAKKILKNAGARGIFKTWYLAAHPGGTAKIGEIVDSNLKTKYENLYVCDCSVVPESWGLPPTLTIIALGKRLAKYLSNELPVK